MTDRIKRPRGSTVRYKGKPTAQTAMRYEVYNEDRRIP